jgi:DNA-binding response OmpR family regulator
VLLDLVMPLVSGLELLRRFRAPAAAPVTPVAIIKLKPLWAEDLIAVTGTLIEGARLSG